MKKIDIRFVCQDLSDDIFFLYHSVDEFINGFNLANNGRIEKIISNDICAGVDNTGKNKVYENDIGILGAYTCIMEYSFLYARFWWIDIISNQWIVGRPSDARIIGNIYDNPELSQMDVHESNSKSQLLQ